MSLGYSSVRAQLVGIPLGKVANLGCPYTALQSDIFRMEHPRPVQSAADRIRTLRVQPDAGEMLSALVQECFNADQRSPARLFANLSSAVLQSSSPPSFPIQIFGNSCAQSVDHGVNDVADCHLHSGAAIDLPNLLVLLVSSSHDFVDLMQGSAPRPGVEPRVGYGGDDDARGKLDSWWASDFTGDSFFLPVVLGAIRAHLARLANPSGWHVGKPACAKLFLEGSFWKTIGVYARTFEGSRELFEELASRFENGGVETPESVASILRLRAGELAVAPAHELDEWMGLMAGICLVHNSVTSVPGEGLSRFASRFDRMGVLRDLTAGVAKPRLIEAACSSVFTSSRVKGAEFRKTVVVGERSVGALENVIRGNLIAHLEGSSLFASSQNRTLRVAMPIGFHRSPESPFPDAERWVARESLSAVGRLTEALINSINADGDVSGEFITGVDVAGDERSMSNWPFLVAFQRLRSSGGEYLRRSIHVGESFDWPLQGVRRIAEALDEDSGVQAVGHALALDPLVSSLVVGEFPPDLPLLEVVKDLCWLVSHHICEDEALSLLDDIALDCGLLSVGIGARDLVVGWTGLFSLSYLRDIGICGDGEALAFLEYANDSMVRHLRADARAAWMLAFISPGTDFLSGFVSGALGGRFTELQEAALAPSRALVAEIVRTRGLVIEACPTSNRRLANIPLWTLAHYDRFVNGQGFKVSVSSDDPIVFNTNVESEVSVIATWFSVGLAKTMADFSLQFCSASVAEYSGSDLSDFVLLLKRD